MRYGFRLSCAHRPSVLPKEMFFFGSASMQHLANFSAGARHTTRMSRPLVRSERGFGPHSLNSSACAPMVLFAGSAFRREARALADHHLEVCALRRRGRWHSTAFPAATRSTPVEGLRSASIRFICGVQ